MTKPICVSAVVVTYNRPDELSKVVNSLLNQTFKLDQIIVFDNASSYPVENILPKNERLFVFRSQDNTGGAGGFSQGLKIALESSSDWFWLMDDDAVPELDALEELLKPCPKLDKNVGVLSSSVIEDGKLAVKHRRYFDFNFGFEKILPSHFYGKDAIEIDTASFVGFLVKREVVDDVGLPNSNFFLAYDDTEYSLRLKKSNWRIFLIPSSRINHLRNLSSRLSTSVFGLKHYYHIRNRWYVRVRYSRFGTIQKIFSCLFGLALWGVCLIRTRKTGDFGLLLKALKDGSKEKLGKFNL